MSNTGPSGDGGGCHRTAWYHVQQLPIVPSNCPWHYKDISSPIFLLRLQWATAARGKRAITGSRRNSLFCIDITKGQFLSLCFACIRSSEGNKSGERLFFALNSGQSLPIRADSIGLSGPLVWIHSKEFLNLPSVIFLALHARNMWAESISILVHFIVAWGYKMVLAKAGLRHSSTARNNKDVQKATRWLLKLRSLILPPAWVLTLAGVLTLQEVMICYRFFRTKESNCSFLQKVTPEKKSLIMWTPEYILLFISI